MLVLDFISFCLFFFCVFFSWRNDLVKLTTTHDVTVEEVNGALVMLDKVNGNDSFFLFKIK